MCQLFASQSPHTYASHTRSVRIGGHSTSLRLESVYWDILEELAAHQGMSLGKFISRLHDEVLDMHGEVQNFASLLRCSCLLYVADIRPKSAPAAAASSSHDLHLIAAE